ncbi:MAG: histidine kinase [Saprospiraceae bacterium]|nr:histidine kinase [Saprospiraceae bacterium]
MSQIVALFQKRIVRHVSLWLVVFVFLIIIDEKEFGLGYSIAEQLIHVFFYIVIVYFNLNYLIPNYLTQKTFITYSGLLILSVVILTPIKTIALYFLYANSPIHQEYMTFTQHYVFLFNFLIAASSTVAKILNDWLRLERDKKDLETQTMQSELKFLKSQINPHFLFNTLNSLYALTLKKSDSAPEIVIKLSEMMRYMLYECNERRVPLRKEVQYIQNYLDLERLRQGQNVQISFNVTGEIKDQQIAPLMFTPFLENSFKHGLNNQISEGFVRIDLEVEQQKVHLQIENSKAPTKPVQNHRKPSGGIGLVNVRRRLNLIYPDGYELNVRDEPHRYKVDLELNLQN